MTMTPDRETRGERPERLSLKILMALLDILDSRMRRPAGTTTWPRMRDFGPASADLPGARALGAVPARENIAMKTICQLSSVCGSGSERFGDRPSSACVLGLRAPVFYRVAGSRRRAHVTSVTGHSRRRSPGAAAVRRRGSGQSELLAACECGRLEDPGACWRPWLSGWSRSCCSAWFW